MLTVRGALPEGLVELARTLEVPRAVADDVMVRANERLEVVADDRAGALGPACEKHDARAGVRERRLEEANDDAERSAGAADRTLAARDRSGVACEGLEDAGELELTMLDGHEEVRGAERLRRRGEELHGSAARGRACPGFASGCTLCFRGRRRIYCIRRVRSRELAPRIESASRLHQEI